MTRRAKITKISLEIAHSDSQKEVVDIDPEEHEALFWSDRSVIEMLAPFYAGGRILTHDEKKEVEEEIGREVGSITPSIVVEMWNYPRDSEVGLHTPAMVLKPRKCIPTCSCLRKHSL